MTSREGVHANGSIIEKEAYVASLSGHAVEQVRANTHSKHYTNPECKAQQWIHERIFPRLVFGEDRCKAKHENSERQNMTPNVDRLVGGLKQAFETVPRGRITLAITRYYKRLAEKRRNFVEIHQVTGRVSFFQFTFGCHDILFVAFFKTTFANKAFIICSDGHFALSFHPVS